MSGGTPNDYAVSLNVVYRDGTIDYDVNFEFPVGTTAWTLGTYVFSPTKPISYM